ncbi:spore germination protein KA [Paenibacillus glycanilyticus]|uniref:Spore germination protein KA n=1 Tax=Paenibacillus glycanilyticus TaxID=126569 RepID=A0ABQ6NVK2_9BACL|nr:spore germination protein [Paenibacillus glycanilyticus]GMK48167.1 spore germination protein KA [Paenibacillus glycanilyticus]
MKEDGFSPLLHANIERMKLMLGYSSDFIVRELILPGNKKTAIFYLDGMVDKKELQDSVISALLDRTPEEPVTLQELKDHVLDAGEVCVTRTLEAALEQLFSGSLFIMMDGVVDGLSIALPGWNDRAITESKTQSVVRGPQDSFTETLRTNTTLVRRRIKDTRIRIVSLKVGKMTKTDVAVMYMDTLADEKQVRRLIGRLQACKQDRVLEGEYLEEFLHEKKQLTIFPTMYNTDRPDTIAAGIMEGKIAIFVDGTPFVMLTPALFVDFIQSAEDYYQRPFYSNLIRLLRYVALAICLLAPSVYIALTTFHQDMLPTQLLLSLAAQREGVPLPAFIEALLMEGTFEILREAGIRMPRTIGQAVSIVGTIVIGQAAVEASIVSAAMVIIVSITAISSFVIPAYAMSIPIRIIRFVFMVLSASFGVYGLTIGIIVLVVHLCHLRSAGIPYLSPSAPFHASQQNDAIFRMPYWKSTKGQTKQGRSS